jgi:predicted ATPase/DNA-binding XRE family transcriptional regulator
MDTSKESSFGALLRKYRLAAGLSQEELAERAGTSARGISDLERGVHRVPYRRTLVQLLEALGLDCEQRAALEAASRPAARGTATREVSRHNLPEDATSFVGRAADIAALEELLRKPEVRLVTLTGPGGSGKTRLALRAAANLLGEFDDGVFFVSLGALDDPQVVPSAIATALSLREREGRGLADTIGEYLAERNLLLVLDNFEHLMGAAGLLAELLEHCPKLRLLVTSREIMRLSWEHVVEVQPLAVPDPAHPDDRQGLARYDGVALFIERARAADSTFAVTEENAQAVAEICYRLDGLPLALELAAARMRVFPPEALLRRTSHQLKLLTGGARDRPGRQQTLRAAIDWSYGLLNPPEQRLLARLAVFADGCTMEAVEAVSTIAADPTDSVDPPDPADPADPADATDIADDMASLVDKSLLRRSEPTAYPEPRLRMLETIREYALERLAESGEEAVVRRQHAAYFLSLATETAAELGGPHRTEWLDRLEDEHDNLRVALRWTKEHQQQTGLRLAVALSPFWELRGYLSEGARWLAEFLTVVPDGVPELRAAALKWAGSRAFASDFGSAAELTEQSLALYRDLADDRGAAEALHQRGIIAFYQADYGRAAKCLAESLDLARGLDDNDLVNRSLWSLAWRDTVQGDISETKQLAQEQLELSRQHRDPGGTAAALEALLYVAQVEGDLGRVQFLLEEMLALLRHSDVHSDADLRERIERMAFEMTTLALYEQAMTLIEEGIALSLREGDRRDAAHLGVRLALFAREQGRFDWAESVLRESLATFRELEDMRGRALALIGLSDVARDRGDSKRTVDCAEEGLMLARECADTLLAGYALHNLGVAAWQQGDRAQAGSLFTIALTSLEPAAEGRAEVLASVGLMALDERDFARAGHAFAEGLRTGRTRDIPWLVSMDLEGLAAVAVGQSSRAGGVGWVGGVEAELAVRIFGATDTLRASAGTPVRPMLRERLDRDMAAARAALSPECFSRAYARGQAMPVEGAITEALHGLALSQFPDLPE